MTLCFVALAAVASARPRFLAIPLEDVEFFRGQPYPVQHRIVRRAGKLFQSAAISYLGRSNMFFFLLTAARDEPEAAADSSYGRAPASYGGGNDYVDYGAYTGGNK